MLEQNPDKNVATLAKVGTGAECSRRRRQAGAVRPERLGPSGSRLDQASERHSYAPRPEVDANMEVELTYTDGITGKCYWNMVRLIG